MVYRGFVREIVRGLKEAGAIPLGGVAAAEMPLVGKDAPVGLNFAPHPDDECINGGLPLRLRREAGVRIVNVPVTLGSDKKRRRERIKELNGACRYLGFEVEGVAPFGFERITPSEREKTPLDWKKAVAATSAILEKFQPSVVFFPHREDRHQTHCGTNLLVMDALKKMPPAFSCLTVENEFWRAADEPNLLVELTEETVAELITALSFHKGELARNPYHLTLPAWLMDNVRRGAEIVGPAGGAAPDFTFGVLHRVSVFRDQTLRPFFEEGRFLSAAEGPAEALLI